MKPQIRERNGRFTVSLEIYDGKGARKSKTIGTYDSREDAERFGWREAEKYIDDPEERAAAHTKVLLKDWVAEWLVLFEDECKSSTLDTYRWRMQKWVLPYLGQKKIADLTAAGIQRWLDQLAHLHIRSRKSALVALSTCLAKAVERAKITENPCDAVKLTQSKAKKKAAKERIKAWSTDDAKKLLATGHPLAVLGLYGGLRRGEMLGTTWEDVNWLAGSVNVHRNVVATAYRTLGDETPKSGDSRTVSLPPDAITALALIKEQAGAADGDRIIPFSPSHATRLFTKLCKDAGVPLLGLHSTRHTCASILLSQRESIVAVQKHLGHSKASVTLDFYSHFMAEDEGSCASTLGSILGQPGTPGSMDPRQSPTNTVLQEPEMRSDLHRSL